MKRNFIASTSATIVYMKINLIVVFWFYSIIYFTNLCAVWFWLCTSTGKWFRIESRQSFILWREQKINGLMLMILSIYDSGTHGLPTFYILLIMIIIQFEEHSGALLEKQLSHGPLTRYVKLRVAPAPGIFPFYRGLAIPTCITACWDP